VSRNKETGRGRKTYISAPFLSPRFHQTSNDGCNLVGGSSDQRVGLNEKRGFLPYQSRRRIHHQKKKKAGWTQSSTPRLSADGRVSIVKLGKKTRKPPCYNVGMCEKRAGLYPEVIERAREGVEASFQRASIWEVSYERKSPGKSPVESWGKLQFRGRCLVLWELKWTVCWELAETCVDTLSVRGELAVSLRQSAKEEKKREKTPYWKEHTMGFRAKSQKKVKSVKDSAQRGKNAGPNHKHTKETRRKLE